MGALLALPGKISLGLWFSASCFVTHASQGSHKKAPLCLQHSQQRYRTELGRNTHERQFSQVAKTSTVAKTRKNVQIEGVHLLGHVCFSRVFMHKVTDTKGEVESYRKEGGIITAAACPVSVCMYSFCRLIGIQDYMQSDKIQWDSSIEIIYRITY